MLRKITLVFLLLALPACAPQAAVEAPTTTAPVDTQAVEAPTVEAPTAEPAPASMTFIDDMGRTVELEGYPQRIVSISPSITEILFAVDAGEQMIGRDEFSIYPEEALSLEIIGSPRGGFSTESIIALEPDLVICAQIIPEEQITVLEDLGLSVYWQANPQDFETLYANITDLAKITGHEAEAAALVEELQQRVAAVDDIVSQVDSKPKVFYEIDATTDPGNPWTTGAGTFIDYIINRAGGVNIAADLGTDYAQISSEKVIEEDPDIILLADAMYGTTPESVAERAGWENITAVQEGAVNPFDPGILSVPGPRLVDGLEEVAHVLHPLLFE